MPIHLSSKGLSVLGICTVNFQNDSGDDAGDYHEQREGIDLAHVDGFTRQQTSNNEANEGKGSTYMRVFVVFRAFVQATPIRMLRLYVRFECALPVGVFDEIIQSR